MPPRATKRGWLIALLLPLAGVATAAEPLPEPAEYFAGKFAPVFADVGEFMELIRVCHNQLEATCGRRMMETAPKLAGSLEVMPLITVFGRARDPSGGVTLTDAGIANRMDATRDRLNRDLLEFDKDLLQRYRALVSVCPFPKADFMPPDLDVTFPRYWQLSPQAYAKTKRGIQSAALVYEQLIRGWSNGRCRETRNFGASILYGLEIRLRPYAEENWQSIPSGKRSDSALTHAVTVAIRFEETVHPDVMKEIEARLAAYDKNSKQKSVKP